MLSGCLASDPPTYGKAEQTPPYLDLTAADPDVYHVLVESSQSSREINVPFRSEDAGEEIFAVLILNYDPNVAPGGQLQTFRLVPPGTFDQDRKISLTWVVPEIVSQDTCQQLTLLVDHRSAFDENTNRPKPSSEPAVATWWVNIDGTAPGGLSGCPNSTETP